jgi:hypothetical protein
MVVSDIKERVMFQTNNDRDDAHEYEPHLLDYINEGYDILLYEVSGVHVGDTGYPRLDDNTDEPVAASVPEWAQNALSDYASYRICLNGNAQRQSRGMVFLASFNRIKGRLKAGNDTTITNIPI